jgi:hypothetical protein
MLNTEAIIPSGIAPRRLKAEAFIILSYPVLHAYNFTRGVFLADPTGHDVWATLV